MLLSPRNKEEMLTPLSHWKYMTEAAVSDNVEVIFGNLHDNLLKDKYMIGELVE